MGALNQSGVGRGWAMKAVCASLLAIAWGAASAGTVLYSDQPRTDYRDFGDAPDSYGTSLANDGARTVDGRYLYLGSTAVPGSAPDYETDATPAPAYGSQALNDDKLPGGVPTAEETGVAFRGSFTTNGGSTMCDPSPLTYVAGCWGKVDVSVTLDRANYGGGKVYLDGWIDWGHDGKFDGGLEHIVSQAWDPASWGASDTQTFTYWFLDGSGPVGPFYARFRLSGDEATSDQGVNSATGQRQYGEVEDYGGLGHVQVPEIDASAGGSALALLLGSVALLGERRRRVKVPVAT